MKKTSLAIALLLFILTVFTGNNHIYAEESRLTLKEAISIALENNNTYKVSLEKVKESRLKVRENWGTLWPSLSTDVSYTRLDNKTGINSYVEGQYNVKFVNAELAVNPGVFYNSLQASRSAHVIAENEVRKVKLDTTIETIKLYYQLLLAAESITLREESTKALEENLRVITVGYNKGTFSKLDYLRAKVSYSNEKTQLINAQNNYLSARAALNIHLGRDINAPVNLVDLSEIRLNEQELAFLKVPETEENEMIGDLISQSLKNRPELIQIQSKREAEVYGAKALESIYIWPTFIISGNYGRTKYISKEQETQEFPPPATPEEAMIQGYLSAMSGSGIEEEWSSNWSITVAATYKWGTLAPIDSTHAKAGQARSQAKQTEYQMEDFIKSVRLEVQFAYLKLKSTSNSIKSQQGNIETAEESLRVSIAQFRNGIIDNTKLLDANVQLTTAKTLYIQALHDYQVAKAELNKAIGKDVFALE